MSPIKYYQIMRNCKDKKQYRLAMVQYAKEIGIKPTAKLFKTTAKTVRKWVRRYSQEGYKGLENQSTRPRHSPRKVDKEKEEYIVGLKKKYKRIGADKVKDLAKLDISSKTIRRIWKRNNVGDNRRRRKRETKRNLREVKKRLRFLQLVCEDTKDLSDIPEYLPYIRIKGLPRYQYTFRDVTSGMVFLGFSNEKTIDKASLFAEILQDMLITRGADLSKTTRQTDNGSEYIGSWNAKEPSSYTKVVEKIKGQKHQTIPVRRHRWQADVETFHDIIEREFFEVEEFKDRKDFMDKVYTYQLFFNLKRRNMYKENKTPIEIANQKRPTLTKDVAMIPTFDLDYLAEQRFFFLTQGGYDVLSNP